MEEATIFYILIGTIFGCFATFEGIWRAFSSILNEWDKDCDRFKPLVEPKVNELTNALGKELRATVEMTGDVLGRGRRTIRDEELDKLWVERKEAAQRLLTKTKELGKQSSKIMDLTNSPSAGKNALKTLRRNLAILVPFIVIPMVVISVVIASVAKQYFGEVIFVDLYVITFLIMAFVQRPYKEYSKAKKVLAGELIRL